MLDDTRWDDWFLVTQALDGAHRVERRLAAEKFDREVAQVERLLQALSRSGAPTR